MDKSKKRSPVFIVLRIAVMAYVGLSLLMTGCQRDFIYYPTRASEGELVTEAAGLGLREWRDGGGRLIGWKEPAPAPEGAGPRVVVFHGNGGMAIQRDYYAGGLHAAPSGDDWEVYLFEYPGYGAREGRSSEARFYEEARQAMEQLLAEDDRPLYLIGESLGSGVASRMAAEFSDRIMGLLLVTPFTTLSAVGARHFPYLPVRLLLREKYDNVTALADYGGPLAILLAENDEVVPADLGQRLYDLYEGPKQLWIQAGQTHNSLNLSRGSPWWEELIRFLEKPAR